MDHSRGSHHPTLSHANPSSSIPTRPPLPTPTRPPLNTQNHPPLTQQLPDPSRTHTQHPPDPYPSTKMPTLNRFGRWPVCTTHKRGIWHTLNIIRSGMCHRMIGEWHACTHNSGHVGMSTESGDGAHHKAPNSVARHQEVTYPMSPKTQSTPSIVVEWAKGMHHPGDGDRTHKNPSCVNNAFLGPSPNF
jgi:hypothetical protein